MGIFWGPIGVRTKVGKAQDKVPAALLSDTGTTQGQLL